MAVLRAKRKENTDAGGAIIDKDLDKKLQAELDSLASANTSLQNENQTSLLRSQNLMNSRNSAYDLLTNTMSKDQ
jgi:hypothetical protein